jgi:hypothetical protein
MESKSERLARHLRDLVSRSMLEAAQRIAGTRRVFRRMVNGERVLASVAMHGKAHRVSIELGRYTFSTRCDCISEHQHCVHAVAVAQTYVADPESFFDLDAFLDDLPAMPKRDLVRIMRAIVGRDPSCINALGLMGFEEPFLEEDLVGLPELPKAEADPFQDEEFLSRLSSLRFTADDEDPLPN